MTGDRHIRFRVEWGIYRAGDDVHRPEDIAERLVSHGAAEYLDEPQRAEPETAVMGSPPVAAALAGPPISKDFPSRRRRKRR